MPAQPQVNTIRTTTQNHLDIEDIIDDVVILKDGSGCLVCQASAINFNLLSEQEQEATIYAYAAILNSLTYPIQILIKSERKDISDYLRLVKLYEDKQPNKLLREHIRRYRRFVEETVQKNNVLDKVFYIVIPFTATELGAPQALISGLASNKKLPFPKSQIIEKAKNHLHPKRDHLSRQFMRLGIQLEQLDTPRLIELFYHSYNPDSSRGMQLDTAQSYAAPIVQGPNHLAKAINTQLQNQPGDTDLASPTVSQDIPQTTTPTNPALQDQNSPTPQTDPQPEATSSPQYADQPVATQPEYTPEPTNPFDTAPPVQQPYTDQTTPLPSTDAQPFTPPAELQATAPTNPFDKPPIQNNQQVTNANN